MAGKEVTGAMITHKGCMLLQPNISGGYSIYDEEGHHMCHEYPDHILSEDEAIQCIEAALERTQYVESLQKGRTYGR